MCPKGINIRCAFDQFWGKYHLLPIISCDILNLFRIIASAWSQILLQKWWFMISSQSDHKLKFTLVFLSTQLAVSPHLIVIIQQQQVQHTICYGTLHIKHIFYRHDGQLRCRPCSEVYHFCPVCIQFDPSGLISPLAEQRVSSMRRFQAVNRRHIWLCLLHRKWSSPSLACNSHQKTANANPPPLISRTPSLLPLHCDQTLPQPKSYPSVPMQSQQILMEIL
jgi:hypothetical protein